MLYALQQKAKAKPPVASPGLNLLVDAMKAVHDVDDAMNAANALPRRAGRFIRKGCGDSKPPRRAVRNLGREMVTYLSI